MGRTMRAGCECANNHSPVFSQATSAEMFARARFRKRRRPCTLHDAAANGGPVMITLYDYLPSQNAYKVRLLLSHLRRRQGDLAGAFAKHHRLQRS